MVRRMEDGMLWLRYMDEDANAAYLDVGYRTLRLFVRDCRFMKANARKLLTRGDYVLLPGGWVVAREYL